MLTTAETSEFLTPEEVAERLRISRPTIYRMLSAGIMPSVRVSPGSLRVERSELDEWLHERRTSSAVGGGSSAEDAVGHSSSVDTPAERDGTSNEREAVEPAPLAGER